MAGLLTLAITDSTSAQLFRRRGNPRLTQVTILPQEPVAALIQPNPAAQGQGRWRTNRPMIQSGFEMPTKPLFLSGYAGRNYGHGVRQGYVPVAPGSAEGQLKMIELKPVR
ncbi:MAG: hypothetical protein RJA81_537 [Planctomycetota bacterium]